MVLVREQAIVALAHEIHTQVNSKRTKSYRQARISTLTHQQLDRLRTPQKNPRLCTRRECTSHGGPKRGVFQLTG
ncbi:hypothetical protein PInf_020335 [Phytophthora infestans]|nr:hypothetical protein PInf_020335 [Phytophthora infestans]